MRLGAGAQRNVECSVLSDEIRFQCLFSPVHSFVTLSVRRSWELKKDTAGEAGGTAGTPQHLPMRCTLIAVTMMPALRSAGMPPDVNQQKVAPATPAEPRRDTQATDTTPAQRYMYQLQVLVPEGRTQVAGHPELQG